MEPLKSKPTSVKACTDTVSSKCVVWDGPEITCIDGTRLCKGQSIDTAVYNMAAKLCEILEAVDIKNYNNCITSEVPPAKNIRELFDFVIGQICILQTEVDDIVDAGCPTPTAVVPPCLIPFSPGGAATLPVDQYAVMVAGVICTMLTSINNINISIDSINSQIDDLWAALANCNKSNEPVQPTCTYDYVANPAGGPVVVQTAYAWLEAAFCSLSGIIGTTVDITNAINKQCPDLNNAPRLYGGGTMSNIPGWTSSPISVADSVGNMWLTVCDMRSALGQVLETCCFSICNYLEFGYDAIWDVNGTYVDITFINYTTFTEAAAISTHTNTWSGTPGGPAPAWVLTDFPSANMTNVIITLNDGTNQITVDTGLTIYQWMIVSNGTNNGYHIDFTNPIFAGYDPTSLNQTITIQFTYQVDDGVTVPQPDCPGPFFCCEVDFTEGFPYECDAPRVSPCGLTYTFPDASSISVTFVGLQRETQQYFPTPPTVNATVDTVSANPDELILSTAGWVINDYANNIVYIDGGTGIGQCRRILSNTATILTVFPDWDVSPDLTTTFYIANDFVPIPYLSGPTSLVNNYEITIYDAAGFNPNDTSTWTTAYYQNNYNINLNVATSITISTPTSTLVPNKSYVVVLVANYNCGPSDPTFVYAATPINVIVELEQNLNIAPIFSAATGTVDNVVSGSLVPVITQYPVSLGAPALFPIDVPAILGDSQFTFEINPGTLLAPNSICKCGLDGDPNETDTTQPDYRGNILGDFRGYQLRIEQFDQNTFTSAPVYDQSIPAKPYITNSIVDPNLTFNIAPNNNTPLPPTLQVPVGYNQPTFWIKGVYDASIYPVSTAANAHVITILGTSTLTINSTACASPSYTWTAGSIEFEVKTWDLATASYISYSPVRKLTFPVYAAAPGSTTVAAGGIVTYTLGTYFPLLANRQLFCKVGDAIYAKRLSNVTFSAGCVLSPPPQNLTPSTLIATPSSTVPQQYSCSGVTKTSTAANNSWIVTEDYDLRWNFLYVLG